jgi:hypothetical protein
MERDAKVVLSHRPSMGTLSAVIPQALSDARRPPPLSGRPALCSPSAPSAEPRLIWAPPIQAGRDGASLCHAVGRDSPFRRRPALSFCGQSAPRLACVLAIQAGAIASILPAPCGRPR